MRIQTFSGEREAVFRKVKEIEEQWSHKTELWMETYKR